jgi:hypothetical protein
MAQILTVNSNMADHPDEAIDVKSTAVTSTMVNGDCRLRSITQTSAGTAGTVVWNDENGNKFTTYSATNSQNVTKFPFPGLRFKGHLKATLANVTGLTISFH